MAVREIPCPPGSLAFSQTITLDGVTLKMDVRWNARAQAFYLDLRSAVGNAIVQGIVLRAGVNLYGRFGLRDDMPPGQIMVVDTSGQDLDPGPNDLGSRVKVLYAEALTLAEALGL